MSYEEIALRAWAEPQDFRFTDRPPRRRQLPDYALVLDFETTIDETQRMLFGSYRVLLLADPDYPRGSCREEGLIYADDLPTREPEKFATLKRYAPRRQADLDVLRYRKDLKLISRSEFMPVFYHWAYKKRALVVGFNLGFDLSRLALEVGSARRSYGGGFSFTLWDYEAGGVHIADRYRPRLVDKSLNSKQHLTRFTARLGADPDDFDEGQRR